MRTVVVLVALLMAGCVQDAGPNETTEPGSTQTSTGQNDVGGGTSAGVERTESEVTVGQSNGKWYARQTVILKNEAAAVPGDASFETVSGGVQVVLRSGSDYQVTVSLEGRGDSEAEAKEHLADMRVDHTDEGTWTLATEVSDSDGDWTGQTASIHASLPSSASFSSLAARTVSGGITIDDVDADRVEGRTTSGGVSCDGVEAKELVLATSSGSIECDATADDADIATMSGSIDLVLAAAASGSWDLSTTSGGIDLMVPEDSGRGYDVTAETTSGSIDFDFQDTQVVSQEDGAAGESRHERTNGYATRLIQTEVDLIVASGSIHAGS